MQSVSIKALLYISSALLLILFTFLVLQFRCASLSNIFIKTGLNFFVINCKVKNLLYPLNYDSSGRNVYYQDSTGNYIRYGGVGSFYYPKGVLQFGNTSLNIDAENYYPEYVVSSFIGWEDIEGSLDKYILLKEALEIETTKPKINKVRIGFSQTPNVDYINNFNTSFAVQNISQIIPKILDAITPVKTHNLKDFSLLEKQKLEKILIKGDVVSIDLDIDAKNKTILKDNNENFVASWVVVRRFNPLDKLSKEFGTDIFLDKN